MATLALFYSISFALSVRAERRKLRCRSLLSLLSSFCFAALPFDGLSCLLPLLLPLMGFTMDTMLRQRQKQRWNRERALCKAIEPLVGLSSRGLCSNAYEAPTGRRNPSMAFLFSQLLLSSSMAFLFSQLLLSSSMAFLFSLPFAFGWRESLGAS